MDFRQLTDLLIVHNG